MKEYSNKNQISQIGPQGFWVARIQKLLIFCLNLSFFLLLSSNLVKATGHLSYSENVENLTKISKNGYVLDVEIRGVVKDEDGLPLSGATIQVKGTNKATVSDVDGNFLIEVSENSTLIISNVGFVTKEYPVGNGTETLNVILNRDVSNLGEVVVVGYGTQRKADVTGAIASVDLGKDKNLPVTNIGQSLTGTPGVQFTSSGRPGQDGRILIRGQNSLSASTDPLIILDGIIFNGSLSDINPQDIESMNVLKDASSTAIYGSKAANGVIMITSKSGTSDKVTINLNSFYGSSKPTHIINRLSPERYLQRRLDWREQAGAEADPAKIASYFSPTEAKNIEDNNSFDPYDFGYQKSWLSSYNLNLSGRSQTVSYFLSGAINNEHGIVLDDNQKRTSARANITVNLAKWLKVGMNSMFVNRDLSGSVGANDRVYFTYRLGPWGDPFHEDGTPQRYPAPTEFSGVNPSWAPYYTDNDETYKTIFSSLFTHIDFPFLPGLSFQLNYSPDYSWHNNYTFLRQDPKEPGNLTQGSKANENQFNWVWENILKYERDFNSHHFDVTFLYGRDHSNAESTTASGTQFDLETLGYNSLGMANVVNVLSSAYKIAGVSSMARLNYRFKNRYLFTATARRDGSSVFSVNHKYATFPSLALGWVLTEEDFFKSLNFFNFLKIRLSYGNVGNRAISPYQSLALSDINRYILGGESVLGVTSGTLGNPNLRWETTTSLDFGLDFSLLSNRLQGTIDLYRNNTNHLIVERAIPVMNGFANMLTNIGEVRNSGIELSLNSSNVQTKDFSWSTGFSFSYNKNRIVHLFETDLDGDGKEDDDVANSWFIGQPINSYFDYEFDGIYQVGDRDIPSGQQPGFVKFKDISGDGILNSDDRTIVGSGVDPKFQFSFSNNFKYKGFSLAFSLYAMTGWIAPFNLINPLVPDRSLNQIDAGWWTEENRSNSRPSLVYSNPLGGSWYFSRDFIRLRDISLSYSFSNLTIGSSPIDLNVFISGKNLFTITNWMGTDPENGGDYSTLQGTRDMFPLPKTFALGFNLKL